MALDLGNKINNLLQEEWQKEWESESNMNNKLKRILPKLNENHTPKGMTRRDGSICARLPSKHCSTGTIPAQYRGYCRNGTGPPLFYCHLRNSDLPFCTSAFYRSGTGKLLPCRYQPAQLHYIASIIYVVAWCWASTSPVQNLLWACHWPRTIQPVSG